MAVWPFGIALIIFESNREKRLLTMKSTIVMTNECVTLKPKPIMGMRRETARAKKCVTLKSNPCKDVTP